MRILVCGGRTFGRTRPERDAVSRWLDTLRPTTIIHGAAPGADTIAAAYAAMHRLDCIAFPADWGRWGRAAGPRRNQKMLDDGQPDLVLAFPSGRGTADMIHRSHKAGVAVIKANI